MKKAENFSNHEPYMKGPASFQESLVKEWLSVFLLAAAACFLNGMFFTLNVAIIFAAALGGDFIFQASGFSSRPRIDMTLFHQALLLALFLPITAPVEKILFTVLVLVAFYRICGGKRGTILQPVCVALAFFQCLGGDIRFSLEGIGSLWGITLFLLWLALRFPKTQIEIKRMLAVASIVPLLCFLHDVNLITALVWSMAAGELLFDASVAPLSAAGRLLHWAASFTIFVLLLAVTFLNEAMIISGLTAGFIAAWIEERSLPREKNDFAKTY